MQIYYFESPHKQITEDFRASVVKVTDGDTIRVEASFRDFSFPIRIAGIAAAELNEPRGKEAQSWLEDLILGKEVDILVTDTRVEKWGRLLADIMFNGIKISEESVMTGHAVRFEDRNKEIFIPNLNAELEAIWS